jgi:hypothetical protein
LPRNKKIGLTQLVGCSVSPLQVPAREFRANSQLSRQSRSRTIREKNIMYLFLLVLLVAIGLVIWFVFISEASVIAKILVAILFIVSLFLHPSSFPLVGFFLRIGTGIFVLFYYTYQKAKTQ